MDNLLVFKEDEIPDNFLCPICSELPNNNIFQCIEGHVICKKCYTRLELCPECRRPYNTTEPIRCRYFEQQLLPVRIECPLKSKGCNKLLSRDVLVEHRAKCCFDFKKFGNFVRVCKQIGYTSCEYKFNFGSVEASIDHFITKHGWILTSSDEINMEIPDLLATRSKNFNGMEIWSPVIINAKEKEGFLMLIPVVNKDQFKIMSLWLPYACNDEQDNVPILVNCAIFNMPGDEAYLEYSEQPITLNGVGNIFRDFNFHSVQLRWLNKRCKNRDDGNIVIVINIQDELGVDLVNENDIEGIVCSKNHTVHKIKFERFYPRSVAPDANQLLNKFKVKSADKLVAENDLCVLENIQEIFEGNASLSNIEKAKFKEITKCLLLKFSLEGDPKTLKYLLDKCPQINLLVNPSTGFLEEEENVFYPLVHFAVFDHDKDRSLEKVKVLLEHNDEITFFHYDLDAELPGVNLLHIATMVGNEQVVKYLLEEGLGVNSFTGNALTPLHFLYGNKAKNKESRVLAVEKLLLEYGANPNIKGLDGATPLDVKAKW